MTEESKNEDQEELVGRTEIVVVIDRSGSMRSIQDDTNGGVNALIKEQREGDGEVFMTLVQFDTEYEVVYQGVNINEVPEFDLHPRGMTALLDGIGQAIVTTQERLANERYDDVIFVIVTDGHENSSKEFKKEQIKSMVEEKQTTDEWQFLFLGANMDAFGEAGSMGIGGRTSLGYTSQGGDASASSGAMYGAISKSLTSYRSSRKKGVNKSELLQKDFFAPEDRAVQEEFDKKAKAAFGTGVGDQFANPDKKDDDK
jgi:uncharacterized protein YegL